MIGTSFGLAFKKTGIRNVVVVGTDIDRGRPNRAQKMGAVDRTEGNLGKAVEGAEIVLIATPVPAMRDIFQAIAPHLDEGCRLVTDTGDTKAPVLAWAQEFLPRHISFVGGHPIVGKLASGPESADAELFKGHPYAVIPAQSARADGVRLLTDIVGAMGAKSYFVDVAEHDSFVAAVNHLPYLISAALIGCTSKSPSWDDLAKVASAPYGALTELASGDPGALRDKISNADETLVYWIDAFMGELQEIRRVLAGDQNARPEALYSVFSKAVLERDRWRAGVVTPASQSSANKERVPSIGENFSELFIGDAAARRRLFGSGRSDKGPKESR